MKDDEMRSWDRIRWYCIIIYHIRISSARHLLGQQHHQQCKIQKYTGLASKLLLQLLAAALAV